MHQKDVVSGGGEEEGDSAAGEEVEAVLRRHMSVCTAGVSGKVPKVGVFRGGEARELLRRDEENDQVFLEDAVSTGGEEAGAAEAAQAPRRHLLD